MVSSRRLHKLLKEHSENKLGKVLSPGPAILFFWPGDCLLLKCSRSFPKKLQDFFSPAVDLRLKDDKSLTFVTCVCNSCMSLVTSSCVTCHRLMCHSCIACHRLVCHSCITCHKLVCHSCVTCHKLVCHLSQACVSLTCRWKAKQAPPRPSAPKPKATPAPAAPGAAGLLSAQQLQEMAGDMDEFNDPEFLAYLRMTGTNCSHRVLRMTGQASFLLLLNVRRPVSVSAI